MTYPPPYVVQVSPLHIGISADFMRRRAPELARDIVAEIDGPEALAMSYGLSLEQWAVLRDSPAFKAAVADAHGDLSGPSGVVERVRRKAAMLIERVGLMDMGVLMGDPKTSAAVKVDVFNSIKDLAGMSKTQPSGSAPGMGGPIIVINVPGPNGEAPRSILVGEAETVP